ncbi:dynamin family protein [Neobacillus mesonae]|uniref:Dynamin family protein n=1 Tax=Neobacillus mesonae TaxID=1193713 RepID=A0A3Q9QY53_9BACI|nr:dynamin family protein [Neobacillus mesonae]AZU63090.1 Dynamin family protein [Neobacillus mesonae]
MVKTANPNETIQTLKQKIVLLYEYFIEQNDTENAEKVKQLAKKLANREYAIAFCGHFSAGKSTMINRVVGENLLPSSPIPTSANLVKVKSGEDYAKVFFKNEKPRLYLAPYDYGLVKNYCKDGDKIEAIEISNSDSQLPPNTVIMDTPGIDSADDAHRIATESAIHLADLILYVMDYNHVQAELNFLFTKELTEAGKDVYLVVNQIDKHKDEELAFIDFQQSVIDSFGSWGVRPAKIFYTSLKYKDHPLNQFQELQQFIADHLAAKDEYLLPSVFHSLKKIAAEHTEQTRKTEEDKLSSVFDTLNELSDQEKTELMESYQKLTSELAYLQDSTSQSEKEFDEGVNQILKNAYLMPFQTRELAERYLESCQPEFKVGFLFSKQKTLEERNARLKTFYEDIVDKTKSQLEWHLREYLLKTLKETKLNQGELLGLAQSFSLTVPETILVNAVKPGARLTGESLLHYTEDVANGVKKIARDQLADFKENFMHAVSVQTAKLKTQYDKKYSEMEKYVDALSAIQTYQQIIAGKTHHINDLLNCSEEFNRDDHHLFDEEEEEYELIKSDQQITPIKREKIEQAVKQNNNVDSTTVKPAAKHVEDHLKTTVARLKHASGLISELPGFQKLSAELIEKAGRLENKGFTVALFGAFSAGKSSFANALMGDKVLPVSPNPTTAAINKIKPVTPEHKHGTALVKFKESAVMLEDVNRSLKVFDLQAKDFQEAAKVIDEMMLEKGQAGVLEKTHFAFLKAFTKGYASFVSKLGTILETDLNEFNEFVALEEKSCYVEWIELYYDCELTRKGITLVDTPGADSINARHTGVAFDYIKNSDAILFVTYYNHAFSKADREFLIQLGRVKESFQLDKMFFIINAIDLAENDEEKEAVCDYVKEQLMKYGIRNPHLYPLSSLMALREKTNQAVAVPSGMGRFEQDFSAFISNDLTQMAVSAAEKEVERVQDVVNKLIQTAQEDRSIKEEKRLDIERQKGAISELLAKQTADTLNSRMVQEAEELIYYIKQRVFFRFGDFFKEAFNPSTLRDDGRNLKKALQSALDEFLESFGFDFTQEMRATTVRLDRFAEKLFAEYQEALIRHLHEINHDLSFSRFEAHTNNELDFPNAFSKIESQVFTKALSNFKNPKAFFEKDEKRFMSDELNNILNPLADQYLQRESEKVKQYYQDEITNEFSRLLEQLKEQSDDFYLSLLAALDGGVSLDRLVEIRGKLAH